MTVGNVLSVWLLVGFVFFVFELCGGSGRQMVEDFRAARDGHDWIVFYLTLLALIVFTVLVWPINLIMVWRNWRSRQRPTDRISMKIRR